MMDSETPLSSDVECLDEDIGTRLQFENPSDAIFASLFLKTDGVSWSSFDILLSAIRHTSFDAKQVTFKDSSDFAARIAQIRERNLMRQREAEVQVAGLPGVILNGLFEALGDELSYNLDLIRKEYHGFFPFDLHCNPEAFSTLYQTWRTALMNCALVHSTWLAPALRTAGRYLLASSKSLPLSVKSPWIGRWTLELNLPITSDRLSLASNLSLLRPLFDRVPNVQRLQLTSRFDNHRYSETCTPPLIAIDSLRALPNLAELSLNVVDDPAPLIQILSAISLPSLKLLRFLGMPLHDLDNLDLPHQFSTTLTAFPSLEAIHSDTTGNLVALTELNGILWRKVTNEVSAAPKPPKFFASNVRMSTFMNNRPGANKQRLWRSSLPTIQILDCTCLKVFYSTDPIIDEVRSLFALCTSLNALSLRAWLSVAPNALSCIPTTVEEFNFMISNFDDDLYEVTEENLLSVMDKWDADLAKGLSLGTSARLHTFRIRFSRELPNDVDEVYLDPFGRLYRRGSAGSDDEGSSSNERSPLLPDCQNICEERGIQFSVEALLLY